MESSFKIAVIVNITNLENIPRLYRTISKQTLLPDLICFVLSSESSSIVNWELFENVQCIICDIGNPINTAIEYSMQCGMGGFIILNEDFSPQPNWVANHCNALFTDLPVLSCGRIVYRDKSWKSDDRFINIRDNVLIHSVETINSQIVANIGNVGFNVKALTLLSRLNDNYCGKSIPILESGYNSDGCSFILGFGAWITRTFIVMNYSATVESLIKPNTKNIDSKLHKSINMHYVLHPPKLDFYILKSV